MKPISDNPRNRTFAAECAAEDWLEKLIKHNIKNGVPLEYDYLSFIMAAFKAKLKPWEAAIILAEMDAPRRERAAREIN